MRLEFMLCSEACPESYEVYAEGGAEKYAKDLPVDRIADLRMRHGVFTVEYRNSEIFRAKPKGDGTFIEDERHHYLSMAATAIAAVARSDGSLSGGTGEPGDERVFWRLVDNHGVDGALTYSEWHDAMRGMAFHASRTPSPSTPRM